MTRTTRTALLGATAFLAAGALALPAFAQGGPGGHGRGPMEMFQRADADNDGRVTRAEVETMLQARFREVDANGDGAVTIEEWQAYAAREFGRRGGDERVQQRRAAMFRGLDQNGDGRITIEEARVPVDAMFRAFDANQDGAVSRDELPGRHGRGPGGTRGG
jgi:Ca2+-binding EF-hand superfamily protein